MSKKYTSGKKYQRKLCKKKKQHKFTYSLVYFHMLVNMQANTLAIFAQMYHFR